MWQKVAKFKGAEYFRKALYVSIQTLCYETQNWAQVQPVSIDRHWDVSTTWTEPWVESSQVQTTQGVLQMEMQYLTLTLTLW